MGQHPVLAGRYALVSPLGRGGMGQVWEGRDERLGRPVAVKLLTGEVLAGQAKPDDWIRRFTREAAVTAGLKHPGVPAIYDAGDHDGGLFLVMEMVDGCTVGELIAEHGQLPVAWAAVIGAQVAAVLAVAHERGIVHRDIKPQNVMLTWEGAAKVLDFGVAGLVSQRITSTGAAVGTPAYMAPEQLHSLPATPRTDLYALGCLIYEMLAGQPVFPASSPAGLMRLQLEQAPAPLPRADVHPALEELVRQLLEKDPARRPAGAREAYDRLLPWAAAPGPLGDVDPATGDGSGLRLYSLLQARISTASAAGPATASRPVAPAGGGAAGPAGRVPAASRMPARGVPAGGGAAGPARRVPATSRTPASGVPGSRRPPGGFKVTGSGHRGAGWVLLHSLWVLPTLLFGLVTWVSFGYLAARHHRLSWLLACLCYLVLEIVGFALVAAAPASGPIPASGWAGLILMLAVWSAGIVHALWVNFTTRLPLLAAERERAPGVP